MRQRTHAYLEFFAGSGLVAEAMRGSFTPVWANDICPKKAAVYRSNHGGKHLHVGTIVDVRGADLQNAHMSWASFPCQDLSLAGMMAGLKGDRSGLVWEWLRVMREMGPRVPPVLVLENVVGLVSSQGGTHYRNIHRELTAMGYKVGAMMLDAVHWVPQSRPRVFVVAVPQALELGGLADSGPNWAHSKAIVKAATGLEHWVWWSLPTPEPRRTSLEDLIEWSAPCNDEAATRRALALIPPQHQSRLLQELANGFKVAPGYRRTRGEQVLELRFDGNAGCLRTPEGGSSRQQLVLKKDGHLATRLLTIREAARLMGAPESYEIPGTYNDAYRALGDAVALPVARFLARNLLGPLATRAITHA